MMRNVDKTSTKSPQTGAHVVKRESNTNTTILNEDCDRSDLASSKLASLDGGVGSAGPMIDFRSDLWTNDRAR